MKFCPRCATPLASRDEGGRPRPACPAPDCGFIHYDNPIPVVAALVEHEGDVILARSKGWPDGWYGLVAGFLERGETPEEGLLREVREELGLTAELIAPIGVYAFLERNQLILAYHVRAEGEARIGDELADIKRVPPDRLRPWPMGTGHAVRDWLRSRRSTG